MVIDGSGHSSGGRSAPLLAIATGLIPCPLTTFIITYATAHGAVKWGLLLSAVFAAGMTLTVALFPLAPVFARTWFLPLVVRTGTMRIRAASALEAFAAIAVITLGVWPLVSNG